MKRIVAATAMACVGFPAAAAWHEATSPNFVIYSDDRADTLHAFAAQLERFDAALRQTRGVRPDTIASQRLTIYIVKNTAQVGALANNAGAAGFYVPRVSGSVAFVPRVDEDDGDRSRLTPQQVLQHEYAHHFMYRTWGSAAFPAWLVEGFAEFNATASFTPDTVVLGAPPLYRAYGITEKNELPVRRLLTAGPGTKPAVQPHIFYGRAWALTHYFTFEPGKAKAYTAYVGALAAGKTQAEAMALLGDPDALDSAINHYAMRRRLTTLTVSDKGQPAPVVQVRALSAGEAAIMPVRLRSQAGVNAQKAQLVVADARAVSASYPDDPAVQVALAEAEYDAKNFPQADAAAARALVVSPRLARAMIYRGLAQQQMALAGKTNDAATWNGLRKWFTRANAIDHDDPWPLAAFYYSFAQPNENARKGLLYAQALAPYDRGLTLEAALLHLDAGSTAPATAMLQRVAFDPHGGASARHAAAALAVLGTQGAAAAATALRGARLLTGATGVGPD